MPGWLLRLGCIAAAGLLPLLLGIPAAVALLLLLPLAVCAAAETDQRLTCCGIITAVGAASVFIMPDVPCCLALAWCALNAVMLFVRQQPAVRAVGWTAACVAEIAFATYLLRMRYAGGFAEGLADEMVLALAARDDGNQMLLQYFRMGLARLEDELAYPLQILGPLGMSPQVRAELTNSLRTTLADSIELLTPQLIVGWTLATVLLTALAGDAARRSMGQTGRLPRFGDWAPTGRMLAHLNVLAVLYLIVLFADQPAPVLLGRLCGAAFQQAYMVLGLAVIDGFARRAGYGKFSRRLWMGACLLFAPFVLVILGVFDRRMDLRRLRRSTDDEGGYEQ